MTTLSEYGEQLKTQLDFNFNHLLCKILNFASYVCVSVCKCKCACVYMCVHVCVCVCVCVCVYVCVTNYDNFIKIRPLTENSTGFQFDPPGNVSKQYIFHWMESSFKRTIKRKKFLKSQPMKSGFLLKIIILKVRKNRVEDELKIMHACRYINLSK